MRGEAVVVQSPGTSTNAYGDTVDDWGSATQRTVTTTAPPEPRPSTEPVQDARNAVVNGWTLYLPPGDPITNRDRVVVRGQTYPIQGTPADWGVGVIAQAYRTEG